MKDLNKKLNLKAAQEFADAINKQVQYDKSQYAVASNGSLLGADKKKGA